ncbi:bifunctional DNA-binding transcriptional regulator/antitoxin component of YhaV-PrlF toxin-antitoxin module [Neorhizobium galegae]|uniref:AbrB/MazE/SpoVT family DNA-binding domain-containing protein n=1 Tax=Neorhizobium galegae TaxID=399 RepID=UPI001FDAACA0|nr:AbrB/MazE/SpoVT family DNA-binding domain-containing protein [Neorhizobium galegae]MBP2548931.1 bifunctional DNA-binding transcriptional regulator/antitoxin component of YhaV-PrlF toxin-antitoxin module [Neorhizobium galegae]
MPAFHLGWRLSFCTRCPVFHGLELSKPMIPLIVTPFGQLTLFKEVLRHLGIQPGEKIEIDLLPDGRAQLRAAVGKRTFRDLHGLLKDQTNGRVLTLEALNDAIAEAGAEAGRG